MAGAVRFLNPFDSSGAKDISDVAKVITGSIAPPVPAPTPTPVPPAPADPSGGSGADAAAAAAMEERRRRQLAGGRASTILTSPLGVNDDEYNKSARKTLLGQ